MSLSRILASILSALMIATVATPVATAADSIQLTPGDVTRIDGPAGTSAALWVSSQSWQGGSFAMTADAVIPSPDNALSPVYRVHLADRTATPVVDTPAQAANGIVATPGLVVSLPLPSAPHATPNHRFAIARWSGTGWVELPSAVDAATNTVWAESPATGAFAVITTPDATLPTVAISISNEDAWALWDGELVGEHQVTATVAAQLADYINSTCVAQAVVVGADGLAITQELRDNALANLDPDLLISLNATQGTGFMSGSESTGGPTVSANATGGQLANFALGELASHTGRTGQLVPANGEFDALGVPAIDVSLGGLDQNYDRPILEGRPDLYALGLAKAVVSALGADAPGCDPATGTLAAEGLGTSVPRMSRVDLDRFSTLNSLASLNAPNSRVRMSWSGGDQTVSITYAGYTITGTFVVESYPAYNQAGAVNVRSYWSGLPPAGHAFWGATVGQSAWWAQYFLVSAGTPNDGAWLHPTWWQEVGSTSGHTVANNRTNSFVAFNVPANWDGNIHVGGQILWTAPGATPGNPGGGGVPEPVLPDAPTAELLALFKSFGISFEYLYGADPVNLSTGNMAQTEEVFTLSGVGDQAIDLSLSFNGGDTRISQLGTGWNFAYGARAQLYQSGSVLITTAQGSGLFFEPDGNDGFVATPGARSRLELITGGVRLIEGDGSSMEFSIDGDTGFGVLTAMVDRQGNAYTFTYGPLQEGTDAAPTFAPLLTITDQAGQSVGVESSAAGRITAFVHPDGRRWELGYSGDSLVSLEDGAGRTRHFAYDAQGRLDTVTGADGVVEVDNTYDSAGRVATQTDGVGSVRTFTYDGNGTTTVTDSLGEVSVVEHNSQGLAAEATDPEGGVTLTQYDSNRNPTKSVDARGNSHMSTFDSQGRVLTFTNAVGETTTYTYNSAGDLTSVAAPAPDGTTATTTFVLNGDGRAVETHRPDGTVTYATYNDHGDTLTVTDAKGNVTAFEYDARGNTVRVVDAAGNATVSTFDLANRLLTSTDARGGVTTYVWDAADNLREVTDAEGGRTQYFYDVNGSLTEQRDPLGRVTTYAYNANLQTTGVTFPDGTTESMAYDTEHRLVKRVNRDGTEVTYTYDGLGRQVSVTDPLDQEWLTGYDATGNPVSQTDPALRVSTTEYDALGRPTKVTDALGHFTLTEYTRGGKVAATVDQLGNRTEFDYDVAGRLTAVTAPDGSTVSYSHDVNGNVTAIVDGRGFTTSYAYDALDRQVLMTDALGGEWATRYDAVGNTIEREDPRGAASSTVYDLVGRPTTLVDAEGNITTHTYDLAGQLLTVVDPLGRTTSYEYDLMGQVLEMQAPDGTTNAFVYDAMGRTTHATDASGNVTSFEYDALGRQAAMIDAAGGRWVTSYDVQGNVTSTVDPLGRATSIEYDAAYRQVAAVDALGNRTETDLDARGAVVAARDALGRETTYTVDSMGRVTSMTAADGGVTAYAYDLAGNLISVTDPRGFITATEFDAMGRPVRVTDAAGEAWLTEYDAIGNVTATEDPLGHRATMVYDAVSRPVVSTDALGGQTTTVYDAAGQVVSVTDALGRVTAFDYNSMGRVSSVVHPDSSAESFTYFASGQTASHTDQRGNVTSFVIDVLGREVSRTDTAGQVWATEYDAVGNVLASVDPLGGRTEATYDALNRPVTSTDALGEQVLTDYTAVGTVASTTDALGNQTTYAYDSMNRPVSVTSPQGAATAYGYDLSGNQTSVTNALGFTVSTVFDALGRPVTVTDPDGGVSASAYDGAGRLISVTDANGHVQSFAYDALGRTTAQVDGEGFATTTTYDAVGNVLTQTSPRGGVAQYVYDSMNRPVTVTNAEGESTSLTYDAAGNVVSSTDPVGVVTRYTYDARGLLTQTVENAVTGAPADAVTNVTTSTVYDARGVAVSVTDARGNATAYSLDALGRVVGSTDALGRVTGAQFDAAGRMVAELHADGTQTGYEFSADGFLVATEYSDRTVTYGVDAVGNRVSMADGVGTSAWVYDWANRVLSDTDAKGNTHTYVYDAVGNQVQASLSDGRVLTRGFDGRGLPVTQTDSDGVTGFAYDADGNLIEVSRPTGVVTSTEFDLVGRATTITHAGGTPDGYEGEPTPASEAPGNAFGHCNGAPGHVNQQPTGCWTGELVFAYDYDDRGLIVSRSVTTDESVTATEYEHDALGRLTQSVTGGFVATYGWDAASNLVAESVSDDVSTNLADDGFSAVRTVNAVNQLTKVVTDVRGPDVHTATEVFTFDVRGNRVGSVTSRTSGKKTHVIARTDYVFDGMDQVAKVHDHGANLNNAKDDSVTTWTRDGFGRGLTVTESGATRSRVFEGTSLVVDGGTRVTLAPNGSVLSEAFETVVGKGSKATTVTVSRDVLTDVLGSAVGIAEDGIINADLRVMGDFGDGLITPTWNTVTGFTGRTETAGLVEFATRVFDPTDKVWVQEDSFAGSVTRASSMNRYAYVEGSPISHVDVLGAYRAAAAVAQQQLSAADYAAFVAGVKAWYATPACVGYYGCQPVFAATQAMQAAQAANFASAMNDRTSPERQSSPVNPDWRPSDQVVNGTMYCGGMADYDARVCFIEAAATQALVNFTATNGPGSTSPYLLDYWRLQLVDAWADQEAAQQALEAAERKQRAYEQGMAPYWDLDKERLALNPPRLDHTPVLDPWSEHAQDLHNLEAVMKYPWFYGGSVSAYDRREPFSGQGTIHYRNGLNDSFTFYTRDGEARLGTNPTLDLLGVAQLERVWSDTQLVAEYGGPFGHNFTFIGSPRTKTPPTGGLGVAELLTYADSARASIENTVGALQTSSIYGDIPLEALEERERDDGTRCVVGWNPRYADSFSEDDVILAREQFRC